MTLIKDIDCASPHAATCEILDDLALDEPARIQTVSNFDELHSAWAEDAGYQRAQQTLLPGMANWYFWAVQTVNFPRGAAGRTRRRATPSAVIRLITRLIFVWFIKEKGLVPDDLFDRARLADVLHDLSDDRQTATTRRSCKTSSSPRSTRR